MKKLVYYVDMDGVLANFNREPRAVERFRDEKNFFYKLKPIKENTKTLKKLLVNNECYILTTSPNERADQDKRKWLDKYISKDVKMIAIRPHEVKADYIKDLDKLNILFDDYGVNVRAWREVENAKAYKIKKGVVKIADYLLLNR